VTGAEESRRCGGTYFLAAISFCRSSASNWAGVICRTTGGGDKGTDESEDSGFDKPEGEGVEGGSEGDGGDNR
jgi:hypothetical protein